ncbi:integrase [Gammaproteobacteria bacterium ESL0073]|nr:integrase [Gammaproteobacteria bacterium ESL0073]
MTRYPKKGKGTKWTQKELLAIPTQWVNDTLADGDGLIGEVRVSKVGDVSIRFKYGLKWQGKKCWYSCGTFPLNDISSIRNQRDKAKGLLKQGIDPRTQKHIDKIEAKAEQQTILEQQKKQQQRNKTFTDLFTTWIEQGVVRQDANTELRRTFEKDVLPVIGSVLIKEITEDHIRTVYKTILARGTTQNPRERTVVKLAADMRQLFKWADMRQPWRSLLINGNPALLVNEKQLISADYTEERDRILTPEEIQTLYRLIQQEQNHYNNATNKRGIKLPLNPATQCAIWICLSTLCRIGELLMAKWEHIDWEEGIWFIPRENVKATRGKKQDHYIYLSDFSVRYFIRLNTLTGHTQWCFPSKDNTSHVDIKSVSKRIGDRQVKFKDRTKPSQQRRHDNSLAVGNREWTPHDLRRTGATMMQELGIDINIIDRCQNHVLAGSKVRRHYLKYEYKDEKQQAWAKLGKRLEEILALSNEIL